MKLPVFKISKTYHNGNIDIKENFPFSNEGQCLSTSICPSAWISITRKFGECHELTKENAKFFDVISFNNNSASEKKLLKYGKDNGLIEKVKIYEHHFYSVDRDEDMVERSLTKDNSWDNDDIFVKYDWIGTSQLALKTNTESKEQNIGDPREILAICYAEHLSLTGEYDLDGIFLDHVYDPIAMSAPAFGIFPHKLDEFKNRIVKEPDNVKNVRSVGKDDFIKPNIKNNFKIKKI